MNILLVRLRLIGDVVFTTPAIRAVGRHFPGARVSYLVEPEAEPVVRHNPHLHEVIVAASPREGRRLAADLGLARLLRRRRFDLVLDFHGGPRAAWLSRLTGAPSRIGYSIRGRRWMYTTAVARDWEYRPRHSVVNQWDLLTPLGIAAPDPAADCTEMAEDAGAADRVVSRLAGRGIDLARNRVIVIHVSAGNLFRRWPAASFIDLTARLAAEEAGRRVVLTSGPSDEGAARRIGREARARVGAALAGSIVDDLSLDLSEFRAVVARSALFIGGDSGPLHIAGTTRTPILGLYGPTLSARSAPWRDPALPNAAVEIGDLSCRPCDQRHCVHGDYRCLVGLAPSRVVAAAERLLAWTGPAGPPQGA